MASDVPVRSIGVPRNVPIRSARSFAVGSKKGVNLYVDVTSPSGKACFGKSQRFVFSPVSLDRHIEDTVQVMMRAELEKWASSFRAEIAGELLSSRIETADTPVGRKRFYRHLTEEPFPHYEETDEDGLYVRVDEDGTRTRGRFVNREFVAAEK